MPLRIGWCWSNFLCISATVNFRVQVFGHEYRVCARRNKLRRTGTQPLSELMVPPSLLVWMPWKLHLAKSSLDIGYILFICQVKRYNGPWSRCLHLSSFRLSVLPTPTRIDYHDHPSGPHSLFPLLHIRDKGRCYSKTPIIRQRRAVWYQKLNLSLMFRGVNLALG